jgi:molybdopterin synthase sulfur carrier subunit
MRESASDSLRLVMRFHLPSVLRRWAGNKEVIELSLAPAARITIAEAFVMLGREYPGIRQRVLDDQGNIRRHVNVFVDGENVRFTQGDGTQVTNVSEVWIYPAMSGGCNIRPRGTLRRTPGSLPGVLESETHGGEVANSGIDSRRAGNDRENTPAIRFQRLPLV